MKGPDIAIRSHRLSVSLALLLVGLAACAGAPQETGQGVVQSPSAEIAAQRAELTAQKAELARRETALAQRLSELAAQESQQPRIDYPGQLKSPASGITGGSSAFDLKAGECYAQVIVPAKFKVTVSEVVKRPESKRIERIPAVIQQVPKAVVVKPETTLLEVIPAQYEKVLEQVMIKPETKRLEVVPAKFEMVDERVLVRPETEESIPIPAVYEMVETREIDEPRHTQWKRVTDLDQGGSGGFSSASPTIQRFGDYKVLDTRVEDAGVMCLVEIPATYKVVRKEVLVKEATTEQRKIPAQYKMVKKRVQTAPATTREVVIPAEYRTVEVVREVRPASTREVKIPAEYAQVMETKVVTEEQVLETVIPAIKGTETTKTVDEPAKIEWRPVLCKVNMTRENVSALQAALTETGLCRCGPTRNVCPADGLIGRCTIKAAQRFAIKKGLAYGENYITIDVVRALGLEFNLSTGETRVQ